jgi:uncharacterized protein YndB with AHSA1/START domain
MSENGTFIGQGTIRFERLLPGPIERVWKYLTESEKRGTWLATGEMELRVGGKVELVFNHADLSPHDEPVPEKYKQFQYGTRFMGTVTAIDPPRLLSHTWAETTGEPSEVTYELFEKGDNVLLVLTHRRLGDDRELLISVAAGWHTHLGILVDHLNGRTPKGFWGVHGKMEEEYAERLISTNDQKHRDIE